MSRRPDRRSAQAQAYRHLYGTGRWKRLSAAYRADHPFCERCDPTGEDGHLSQVCDHVDPTQKLDPAKFFDGPFMALCKPCHDGPKQSDERKGRASDRVGYHKVIGADGWPIDERHPSRR